MSQGGYPAPGYPGFTPPGGDAGYPPAGQYPFPGGTVGYPGAPGAGAFPPAGPGGVYPPAMPVGGYPPAGGGYPPAAGGGYPSAMPGTGFPQGGAGYPPAAGGGFQAPQAAWGYPAPPSNAQGYPAYPGAPGAAAAGYGAPGYGGYPQAGGQTYPGGAPAAAAPSAPAPGYGAPGYGGYSQPGSQNYGGGNPAPGGYPTGPAPCPAMSGPQPPSSQPSMPNMTTLSISSDITQGTIRPVGNFNPQNDAEVIRRSMKGAGTDEQAIIDIVSNRSNDQRQKIKLAFKTLYGKDLIKDLKSELSGNMEEVILALFMPTTYYDAWSVRKAMEGAGTQDRVLIEILCTRSNNEIQEIVRCYKSELGRDIEKDLKKDTSGHFRRLLISMSQGNRDETKNVDQQKAHADAEKLYRAGEGKLGTDESTFNMVLATRSYPQLRATLQEYSRMTNRELINSIDREFSGDVRDGMHAIVQCVMNRPAFFAEKLFKAMKGLGTSDSTIIRVIVTRSEIDLVQIKQAFWEKYQKSLRTMVEHDTSGDYKRMLLSIVGN